MKNTLTQVDVLLVTVNPHETRAEATRLPRPRSPRIRRPCSAPRARAEVDALVLVRGTAALGDNIAAILTSCGAFTVERYLGDSEVD